MFWRYFSIGMVVCSLWLMFSGPASLHADGPTIVINELMWMGSSASTADEWIELRNTTNQPISLSGWQLTKRSSGQEVPMVTLPVGASIPANGFFVISNYPSTSTSSVLQDMPNYVTTDVALNNSALQIRLYDAGHLLIDTADDGVGNPLAGNYDSAKKMYASMERNPVPGDGTLAQHWHSASRGVGLKSNVSELGTPGTMNSNGLPLAVAGPAQSALVGQIVNFDGSDSVDPENQPLSFQWDFGDGSSSNTATPTHVYAVAGVYTVTLTVSDSVDVATDATTITVTDGPTMTAQPTPTSALPNTTPTSTITTSCRGITLSEVFPNPMGVDTGEFIELANASDEDVPLAGCSVWTTATRKFSIKDSTVVLRGGVYLLHKSTTKLTLNNGGTTVRLMDSDGTELDRTTYSTAPEGQSWSLIEGAWQWTTKVTAGGVNILVKPIGPAKKTTSSTTIAKIQKAAPPAVDVTLSALQDLDSGDRVRIRGVVVSPRDALGSTLITLQSDSGGVVASIPNGEPTVKLGDEVQLTGTVRLKQGRRYLAAEAKSVRVLAATPMIIPSASSTDDVGAEQADQLVHIHGVVGLASGNTIQLDDGSGPLNVYLKSSTGIVRPTVKAGDTVDVVGVVSASTSGIRVLPRMQADVHVERVLGAQTSTAANVITPPAASPRQSIVYWGSVGLGILGLLGLRAWKQRRDGRHET
jgi:PKD repeat protein